MSKKATPPVSNSVQQHRQEEDLSFPRQSSFNEDRMAADFEEWSQASKQPQPRPQMQKHTSRSGTSYNSPPAQLSPTRHSSSAYRQAYPSNSVVKAPRQQGEQQQQSQFYAQPQQPQQQPPMMGAGYAGPLQAQQFQPPQQYRPAAHGAEQSVTVRGPQGRRRSVDRQPEQQQQQSPLNVPQQQQQLPYMQRMTTSVPPSQREEPPMQAQTTAIPPTQTEERRSSPAWGATGSSSSRRGGSTAYMHAPQSVQSRMRRQAPVHQMETENEWMYQLPPSSSNATPPPTTSPPPQQQQQQQYQQQQQQQQPHPKPVRVPSNRAPSNIDRHIGLSRAQATRYAEQNENPMAGARLHEDRQQQPMQPGNAVAKGGISRRYEAEATESPVELYAPSKFSTSPKSENSSPTGGGSSAYAKSSGDRLDEFFANQSPLQQQKQQSQFFPQSSASVTSSASSGFQLPNPMSQDLLSSGSPQQQQPQQSTASSGLDDLFAGGGLPGSIASPQAGRFQVLRHQPIGSGGFGTVYMGFDTEKGSHVAVKEMALPTSASSSEAAETLEEEFSVLSKLAHPNIVKVFQHRIDHQLRTSQIFMEWMSSGSVKSIIEQTGFRLHENVIRRYTMAALDGLAYLHSKNFLHRDVKPANMLVGGDGAIKLSDFGTSKLTQGEHTATTTAHVVGTCAYMAPESISRGKYSPGSDLWALACSIVEMASGKPPWDELPSEQKHQIPMMFYIGTAQPPNHHPKIPPHLSNELKQVVEQLFAHDPKERLSAASVRLNPYFSRPTLPTDAESMADYRAAVSGALSKRSTSGSSFEGFVSDEVSHSFEDTLDPSLLRSLTGEGATSTDTTAYTTTASSTTLRSAIGDLPPPPPPPPEESEDDDSSNAMMVRQQTNPYETSAMLAGAVNGGSRKYKDIHVEGAIKIQALTRMALCRKEFLTRKKAVKRIEQAARQYIFGRLPAASAKGKTPQPQQQQQQQRSVPSAAKAEPAPQAKPAPPPVPSHLGAKGWRLLTLPNGDSVYHNIISNKSQWEPPEEMLLDPQPSTSSTSASVASEEKRGTKATSPGLKPATASSSGVSKVSSRVWMNKK